MDPDMISAVAPVIGLVVGSFVGVVSLRLPQDRDIVFERSRCGACARVLGPLDLLPLLSWLTFRGRCRTCQALIPLRYPLAELACGAIGFWALVHHSGDPQTLLTAAFGWTLLLIAIIDAEHFWLPDLLTLPLLGSGLLISALWSGELLTHVSGAVAGWAGLSLLATAYRRIRGRQGLGDGDPILLAAIGAWVGWKGLPTTLLLACVAAFSLIAAKMILNRPVRAHDRLPFGVFLAVGGWLTWLYGPIGGR